MQPERIRQTHELIKAYGIDKHMKIIVSPSIFWLIRFT